MRAFSLLAALGLALAAAPATRAQTGFMPYVGYNFDADAAHVGVAARAGSLDFVNLRLVFQPGIEVALGDADYVQADANLVAELTGTQTLSPYVGAGLGAIFVENNSEFGLNLVGGTFFNTTSGIRPFAQARFSTAVEDAFSIQGGLVFEF